MSRYNKAFAGSAGAAIAMIISWAITEFGGVEVPLGIQGALAMVLSGLGPLIAPPNDV